MLWLFFLALVVHLAENPRDLRGLIWLSLVFKSLNMQPLGKLCVFMSLSHSCYVAIVYQALNCALHNVIMTTAYLTFEPYVHVYTTQVCTVMTVHLAFIFY